MASEYSAMKLFKLCIKSFFLKLKLESNSTPTTLLQIWTQKKIQL